MKQIIAPEKRYFSDMGDIRSHFLFSFASYYDPSNMNWGDLRVFNDDFVGAGAGFPMHPHRNFEIMTIMLQGTITHKDSLGNFEKIHAGEVQVTNTGSGISHSEFNEDKEDIQLYQIWFSPKNVVPIPSYYTAKFTPEDFKNTLGIIASGIEPSDNTLISDITVKRGIFDEGSTLSIDAKNYVLVYVTSGKIELKDGTILGEKCQLRLHNEGMIEMKVLEKTDMIVIESL